MPSLPLTDEQAERVRSAKSVILVIANELGVGTTLLHRFGILSPPETVLDTTVVELDPHRFLMGIKQQPFTELPERWQQRERVDAIWQRVRDELALVDNTAALLDDHNNAFPLIRLWGEELHRLRAQQSPEEVREHLNGARDLAPPT